MERRPASAWPSGSRPGTPCSAAASCSLPGEVVLEPGEAYTTPWLYAAWSDAGLDGVSDRLHRLCAPRPQHPRPPRPVVLNTWEAVYFDHRLDRLTALADVAAEIGVERFVLDDGWFRHRRHDRAGLGDWYVDPEVWPDGLAPADRARHAAWAWSSGCGSSRRWSTSTPTSTARTPTGCCPVRAARLPPSWRHQQVLDLAKPDAYDTSSSRLDALLATHDIGYLKWDHNRDLVEPVTTGGRRARADPRGLPAAGRAPRGGTPVWRSSRCSSGGARVDLEHPRAHRPGLGQRHQRRARAPGDPALDRAAAATRAGGHPRRAGRRPHTTGRTHDLALPRGDRAVRPLRNRVGHHHDRRRGTQGVGSLDRRPTGGLRPLLHTGRGRTMPTTPTLPSGSTGWWRPTSPRPCSRLWPAGHVRASCPRTGHVARPGPGTSLRRGAS